MSGQKLQKDSISHPNSARFSFLGLIVCVITVTILTISVQAWFGVSNLAGPAISQVTDSTVSPVPVPTNLPQTHVEAEVITIRPTGFDPAEITRPAGKVLLAINNSANLDEVVLRLQREHGPKLHEERLPNKKQKFRKVINFTPGNYVLTEANHPGWSCRITITN